jgi:hypothetical protein
VIDLTAETPLSLAAAAKLVPPARSGRRTHLSTLLRWVLHGTTAPNGTFVRLEAVRLGGRWMTSREALQRYAERITPRLDGGAASPTPRSASARQRSHNRATAELTREGI